MKNKTSNEVQMGMSVCLMALGFEAMAGAVQFETDRERLMKYARVIIKNARGEMKQNAIAAFQKAGLCL